MAATASGQTTAPMAQSTTMRTAGEDESVSLIIDGTSVAVAPTSTSQAARTPT